MRFLTPGWLVVAGVASLAVLAMHLLNRQRLRPRAFPTARFVPEAPVRAVSYAVQPTDMALLLLRIGVVALVGLALARPVSAPPRRTAVIVLADQSPGADSLAVAAEIARLAPDTVIPMHTLSAGLISARRAGARFATRADSVELTVVSGLPAGLWDAATGAMRATWQGRIALVGVSGRPWADRADEADRAVEIDAAPDHPVWAALVRLGRKVSGGPVRVVWPSPATAPTDTVTGVYAAGAAVVGRLPRFAAGQRDGGTAVAWFTDGSPAAMEYPSGQGGCERVVGFAPDAGDGLLRASGLRIVERLIAPCGTGWTPDRYLAADSGLVTALAGTGLLAPAQGLHEHARPPIALLPLLLALAMLGGERFLRRRTP